MIKVCIVDDHPIVIEGIRRVLEQEDSIQVVGAVGSAWGLIAWLQTGRADIILLDIEMSDMDGIQVAKILREEFQALKVIALTGHRQVSFIEAMTKNGASGYLYKNSSKQELIAAIRAVHAGCYYFTKTVQEKIIFREDQRHDPDFIPRLTRREQEVLDLVYAEKTNQEIADLLFLSVSTIETHRLNLGTKLKARNAAGLIKNAIKLGLLS